MGTFSGQMVSKMGNYKKEMNMREAQAAETKKKLLDSAQRLFAQKGYKGTSVREINRSVNLADGLLYHYFPGGKKEIFQVIVELNVREILQKLAQKNRVDVYLEMPLEEVLEIYYENVIEVVTYHMDMIRILLRENEVREFVTKEQMLQLTGHKDSLFQTLLEKKYERGEIRKMDFESAALSLKSILMNSILTELFGIESKMMRDATYRKKILSYHVELWKGV